MFETIKVIRVFLSYPVSELPLTFHTELIDVESLWNQCQWGKGLIHPHWLG
jgi:hypothetical protein